jgi:hypothetical protein
MPKLKTTTTIAAVALTLAACASTGPSSRAPETPGEAAQKEAERAGRSTMRTISSQIQQQINRTIRCSISGRC